MERIVVLALMVLAFPYAWAHPVTGAGEPIPDSIHRDLAQGRYWRASLALRDYLDPIDEAPVDDRMVLAQAEAGWKNWAGVVGALASDSELADPPLQHWYLLGTALHSLGRNAEAAVALERYVERAPGRDPEALIARSRLIRSVAAERGPAETLAAVTELRGRSPVLADWTALAAARVMSDQGDAETAVALLDLIVDPAARSRGWFFETQAWLVAGDTAAALAVLEAVEPADEGSPTFLETLGPLWRHRLAQGDSAGAASAMVDLLGETTRGAGVAEAARTLMAMGAGSDSETLLRTADALAVDGEYGLALRAWATAAAGGAVLSDRQRLSRARALNGVGERDRAVAEYRELAESTDPATAAPALQAWAGIRRRQGRRSDVKILEDRLVERFPTRGEALDVVFFRGDDLQDAGRLDQARSHYEQVVAMHSSADRAGLARMRWAQIHLARGELTEAVGVFQGYLDEFPNGRRWEEASYWGAWAAERAGDTATANALIQRLQRGNPLSYYSVLAAELDGHPFTFDFPPGPQLPDPTWLITESEVLATLDAAGLADGAEAHVAAMKTAAWDSEELVLRLAVELNGSGRTMDGINLGWELRRRGRAWDETLLRVVYPFPYRDMVMAMADELELDPYLLAGIIRQESAFVPDIVSRAGAIGLMQVMPATGRQLARSVGPRGFSTQVLTTPEVNVHLGTRFLADLLRRYGNDIPLVLSAYNAGPGRADRWKRFPEADDPRRFTERIPFAETRGYVKNVTRNRALYRWLYGDGGRTAVQE